MQEETAVKHMTDCERRTASPHLLVLSSPKTLISLFLVLVGLVGESATAADFSVTPSIAVSEEYNDNIFETETGKRTDYITRILPGGTLLYSTPLWDWNTAYTFDYRYYARRSRDDDTTHNLSTRGLVKVVDEVVFLELTDTYKRVSLDVSRDTSNESLFVNQSDQNIFSASPFVRIRSIPQTTVKSGYRYTNTWYKDPSGIDKTEHRAFADLSYEYSPYLTLTAGYIYALQETSVSDFTKHDVFAGLRYEYAEKSFLFAQAGNAWIVNRGGISLSSPVWNAGITHDFGTVVATVSTELRYTEDPLRAASEETTYGARIEKRLERGSLAVNASYSDFVDTATDRLENRRYGGGFAVRHELTERLAGSLGFNAERYEQELRAGRTHKFFVDAGLTYLLPESFTLALNYRFIDYSSPQIAADNHRVNRAIVELRKTF